MARTPGVTQRRLVPSPVEAQHFEFAFALMSRGITTRTLLFLGVIVGHWTAMV